MKRIELTLSGPDTNDDGIPDPSTADTYTYYADGGQETVSHASTSTTDTFTYDLRGHLSSATVGGVSTTYAYDTEGNRVDESTGGDATTFLVDPNNPTGYAQVLEQQGDTNLTYILGASVLGQIDSAGHADTFVTDGQGSTRMVLDDAGNIVTRFDYDAFGNIINPDASQDVTLIRYTNEMWDPATSEYDLRAREYQPSLGRFTSQDSMFFGPGDLGNANLFLYVNGNPINAIDPSGHVSTLELSAVMALSATLMLMTLQSALKSTVYSVASAARHNYAQANAYLRHEVQDILSLTFASGDTPNPEPLMEAQSVTQLAQVSTSGATSLADQFLALFSASISSFNGQSYINRPGAPEQDISDSQGNPVRVIGQSGSSSTTPGHADMIDQIANEELQKPGRLLIFKQRSLSTALGSSVSRLIPDVVVIRAEDGQIKVDAYEVRSRSQTDQELNEKLAFMKSLIPANMQGDFAQRVPEN